MNVIVIILSHIMECKLTQINKVSDRGSSITTNSSMKERILHIEGAIMNVKLINSCPAVFCSVAFSCSPLSFLSQRLFLFGLFRLIVIMDIEPDEPS